MREGDLPFDPSNVFRFVYTCKSCGASGSTLMHGRDHDGEFTTCSSCGELAGVSWDGVMKPPAQR